MRLYGYNALSRTTGVSVYTLRTWVAKGLLTPTARVGNTLRFTIEDFTRACNATLASTTTLTHADGYERTARRYQ